METLDKYDIIELSVIVTDIMKYLEFKTGKTLFVLTDLAEFINNHTGEYLKEYNNTYNKCIKENKEIIYNSFIRFYFEKLLIDHFDLKITPFYTIDFV